MITSDCRFLFNRNFVAVSGDGISDGSGCGRGGGGGGGGGCDVCVCVCVHACARCVFTFLLLILLIGDRRLFLVFSFVKLTCLGWSFPLLPFVRLDIQIGIL